MQNNLEYFMCRSIGIENIQTHLGIVISGWENRTFSTRTLSMPLVFLQKASKTKGPQC